MKKYSKISNVLLLIVLVLVAIVFIAPFYIVLISSFKSKSNILEYPFLANQFILDNYINGLKTISYFKVFLTSLFITVFSTIVIIIFTAMASWMIVRVKTKFTNFLYYAFLVSMIVPFQLIMYPLISTASNWFYLDNIVGIIFVYLGFSSGLSVFIFCGFVKSVPIQIEEAAMIDGATPFQTFFRVILPMMRPTVITVAILNIMWIWNDYLLPSKLLSDATTIPVALQMFVNSYGNVDYGQIMAIILVSILPVIIFYLAFQKHIISGVISGAVKG